MSVYALITGTLHKPAEARTSKSGNAFCTARIRVQSEDRDGAATTLWASVIAFAGEHCEALQRLKPGDAVSVGGRAKLVVWEKDGKSGVGLDIVADTVAVGRPAKPKPRRDREHQAYAGSYPPRDGRPFDDPPAF